MNPDTLTRTFARMGARVLFGPGPLDVLRDKQGEFYRLDLDRARNEGYQVVDVSPARRHLVLSLRGQPEAPRDRAGVERFLCGHDERHWFVAGLGAGRACKVEQAMDRLRPPRAQDALREAGVRHADRLRRHNAGFLRQGEWFFIPHPWFEPADMLLLRNEPLSRGIRGSKPHIVEFAHRTGGVDVMVSDLAPQGLPPKEHRDLLRRDPEAGKVRWTRRALGASVMARGRVRHPDHATLILPCWHQVTMAAEAGSRQSVFLD